MRAYKTGQGKWQVNFSVNGKQRTPYLGGDFTSGSADRVARIVTDILACRNRRDSVPLEILRKIETLSERVPRSFEKHGLIDGATSRTLETLLESFYESKAHLKPSTQTSYKAIGNLLLRHFGGSTKISSIEKSACERLKTVLHKDYPEFSQNRS